jgi:Tfp pilus assembly protein PilF
MRTEPLGASAARGVGEELRRALERAAGARPALREAVVGALVQAFAPAELQALVAELAWQQRAVCEAAKQEQLAAAASRVDDGDLAQARAAAEEAVRLDFIDPEGHRVLGEILEDAGEGAAAHTEYVLAMHLGWDGAGAKAAIARTEPTVTAAEATTSPEEARYRNAIDRAIGCIERRDLAHARRHARTAVSLDPARPEGFNLLGVLAELAGLRGEARTQYRVAAELDPAFRPAAENLRRLVRPWMERSPPLL